MTNRRRRAARPGATLSPRERQALSLIADGYTTREFAQEMGISIKTAETHRLNLMAKLDLYTIADLTKYAIKEGLSAL
jgi:DNA-binding CsgD family transcriptional regulator